MRRILTVGNSFADNALSFLPQLAAGHAELFIGEMNLGGCPLEKHWNLVKQCDLLPEVKPYLFKRTGMEPVPACLREALVAEKWDYITMQQVSDQSFRPETYFPFLQNLYDLAKELAPQATVVLQQTWAYRCDAPELIRYEITQAEMHERLTQAYQSAAEKLCCRLLPSGHAFALARAVMGYKPDLSYDFEHPQPCILPDQTGSLIIGYYWQTGNTPTGNAELHMDGRHGNALGRYLVGAVWYEMFTGLDVRENPFCPADIPADTLQTLQNAAHAAVLACGGPL